MMLLNPHIGIPGFQSNPGISSNPGIPGFQRNNPRDIPIPIPKPRDPGPYFRIPIPSRSPKVKSPSHPNPGFKSRDLFGTSLAQPYSSYSRAVPRQNRGWILSIFRSSRTFSAKRRMIMKIEPLNAQLPFY